MNTKKPLFRRLSASALMLALITPFAAKAVEYAPGTPVQQWEIKSGVPTGGSARSCAVSKGRIFTLEYSSATTTAGVIHYTDLDTKTFKTITLSKGTTVYSTSSQIAADDAGSIVFGTGTTVGGAAKKFGTLANTVTADNSANVSARTASFTPANGTARYDFIGASGKIRSASGGYIYIQRSGTDYIERLKIVTTSSDKQISEQKKFTGIASSTQATCYVKPNRDDPSEVVVFAGGSTGANTLYKLDENTGTATKVNKTLPGRVGAMLLGTGDKKFLIYNNVQGSGWSTSSIGFVVENYNNPALKSEITIQNQSTTSTQTGTSTSGLWLDAWFDETGNNIEVYAFQQGIGAWKYIVPIYNTAPAAPTNLTVQLPVNTTDQPNRIDAVFTWTNSTSADATKHILQYKNSDGVWENVKSFTNGENTYTIKDVTSTRTYRIIAQNDKGVNSDPSNEVLMDPPFLPYIPIWDGDPRNYDGYAKVQLRWNFRGYGHRPSYYRVYRDGELVSAREVTSNFLDLYVPEGDHTYELHSVYELADGTVREEVGISTEKTVHVNALDRGKNQYSIEEIYNYRIDDDSDGKFPYKKTPYEATSFFNDQELYRQGVYYKGYWFIYQREDNISYDETTGEQNRGTGQKGGIIRIEANAGNMTAMGNSAKRIYETDVCTGIGIAVDDKGTFFIKTRTNTGTNSVWDYSAKLTHGKLIRFDENFENVVWSKDIDFGDQLGTNRCDYYSMNGDVKDGEGCLFLAETSTSKYYCVKFKNGAIEKISSYDHKGTDVYGSTPSEPYAFPLVGRNDVVHNVRSTGYYNVDVDRPAGEESYMMLNAYTRVNNAGGISYWLDASANDVQQGLLFLIIPESPTSKNVGNFYAMLASSPTGGFGEFAQKPADALVNSESLMPILTYAQTDVDYDAKDINANGNWYGCEASPKEGDPNYSVENGDDKGGFFLYQYVPGMRFAKYRIYSSYSLPNTEVEYDCNIRYEKDADQNNIAIKAIDGVATWNTVQGIDQGEVQSYRTIHRYQVEFVNEGGKVFETKYFDAAGTQRASLERDEDEMEENPETYKRVFPTYNPTMSTNVDKVDEDDVTARVTVYYRNLNNRNLYTSMPAWATNKTTYHSEPATEEAVKVYSFASYEADGTAWANYRIHFDFNKPVFTGGKKEEPVTYYQIEYKDNSGEWKLLDQLYYAAEQPSEIYDKSNPRQSSMRKAEGTGNIEDNIIDRVPGTIDFENSRVKFHESYDHNSLVVGIHKMPLDDAYVCCPINWQYRIAARYAAEEETPREGFKSIARNEYVTATPTYGGITGIENVDDSILNDLSGNVYNLQGILLINNATDEQFNQLPAGVYIRSGQLVYKK